MLTVVPFSPESLSENATVESIAEGSRDGALREGGARLVREVWGERNGHPTHDYWMEIPDGQRTILARGRTVVAGYTAISQAVTAYHPEDERFFTSLSIESRQPGLLIPRR